MIQDIDYSRLISYIASEPDIRSVSTFNLEIKAPVSEGRMAKKPQEKFTPETNKHLHNTLILFNCTCLFALKLTTY